MEDAGHLVIFEPVHARQQRDRPLSQHVEIDDADKGGEEKERPAAHRGQIGQARNRAAAQLSLDRGRPVDEPQWRQEGETGEDEHRRGEIAADIAVELHRIDRPEQVDIDDVDDPVAEREENEEAGDERDPVAPEEQHKEQEAKGPDEE